MFRFSLDLTFGRVNDDAEPEPIPGEGGPGNAQVAHIGTLQAGWDRMGFGLPPVSPENPGWDDE